MNSPVTADEDQLDQILQLNSWAFLGLALALGFSALRMVADADSLINLWADMGRTFFLIVTPLLVVAVLWKNVTFKRRGNRLWLMEGYIYRLRSKAITMSWLMTFLTLAMLPEILEGTDLGPKFYTRMASAVLTGTFGLTYLILSFSNQTEEELS